MSECHIVGNRISRLNLDFNGEKKQVNSDSHTGGVSIDTDIFFSAIYRSLNIIQAVKAVKTLIL